MVLHHVHGSHDLRHLDQDPQPALWIELTSLLLKHYSDDGLVPTKPILVVVSDGEPDHCITYASVQVALLCLFISLNLDMLVVCRTCPYQSWQNITE